MIDLCHVHDKMDACVMHDEPPTIGDVVEWAHTLTDALAADRPKEQKKRCVWKEPQGERVVRNLLRAIAWDAECGEKEILDGELGPFEAKRRSAVAAVREYTRVIRVNCDKLERAVRKYFPETADEDDLEVKP